MLYNVSVAVVANLEADSEASAVGRLSQLLEEHGFTAAQDLSSTGNAFVAEEGTVPSTLYVGCLRHQHQGHERHALCVVTKCRAEVHYYAPGTQWAAWRHTEELARTLDHDAQPATGTEACACEWDEKVAKRGGYN